MALLGGVYRLDHGVPLGAALSLLHHTLQLVVRVRQVHLLAHHVPALFLRVSHVDTANKGILATGKR